MKISTIRILEKSRGLDYVIEYNMLYGAFYTLLSIISGGEKVHERITAHIGDACTPCVIPDPLLRAIAPLTRKAVNEHPELSKFKKVQNEDTQKFLTYAIIREILNTRAKLNESRASFAGSGRQRPLSRRNPSS